MSRIWFLLFIITLVLAACSASAVQPVATATQRAEPELDQYFQGFDGAFVLYNLENDRYIRYNPEQCDERLLPASTFKIMNALVELETGVVMDEEYVIPWDGTKYEIESWNQDHTLKSAFQNSVVWYYREVAQRIGNERMQQYIDSVGYGNQDIGGDDPFWLNGALRISANEQVEFLKSLYFGDLPFSQRSMQIVRDMMLIENGSNNRLRGKTGSGFLESRYIGWFVGYQEVDGHPFFFATNIVSPNPDATGKKAKEISINVLQEIIP
jgi:beta-lactamase class D